MAGRRLINFCIVLALAWMTHPGAAFAQEAAFEWSQPYKISDRPGSAGGAAITGDSHGNVYVIWAGYSDGKRGSSRPPDVGYFRHWDGQQWSASTDVVAAPPGSSSWAIDSFIIDAYGRLAMVWHADRQLFFSTAQPSDAGRAIAWQHTTLMQGEIVWGGELESGPDDRLHVITAGEGQNVYYLQSSDAGQSWQAAARVASGSDSSRQAGYARLAAGNDGALHATWTEHYGLNNWTPSAVLYARSSDGGVSWTEPIQIVEGVGNGQSNITVSGGGQVLVFWDRSVGSKDGRYYAVSTDNGQSWGRPVVAFDGVISGFSGMADLWWDSRGRLHLLNGGQGPEGNQIWESQWQGEDWGSPAPVSIQGQLLNSEVFGSALVGGNRILLAWVDYDTKEVWFTSKGLATPLHADRPLSLPTHEPTRTSPPQRTPTVTPTRLPLDGAGTPAVGLASAASWIPMAAAALPVLLLVVAVVVTRRGTR